ncbi:ras guanine nucleotide exchange factor domain-containing protein [Morchella snyderi]|nr:ras guanine nucleotide exchange factor domain-containing protein [Morchella snyderi]
MAENRYSGHESVYVAPLRIQKPKRTSSNASRKSRPRSHHSRNQSQGTQSQSSHQQMTPPPTPSTSQNSLATSETETKITSIRSSNSTPAFKPFVRAFFPFHPTFSADSSTVTLPLNAGDLILVHSIHTNGWADGTMLSSGARGWLPTNYCEEYDLDQIQLALKACMNLFDQFKTGNAGGPRLSQSLVGDVVAGVRYLLESTQCLTREATTVKNSNIIRKSRKVLLTEVSHLIKAGKRLPGHSEYHLNEGSLEDLLDEIILRTFKIVLRGVKFLDNWIALFGFDNDIDGEDDAETEDAVPLTPPADSTTHNLASRSLHTTSGTNPETDSDEGRPRLSARDQQNRSTTHDVTSGRQDSHPLPSTPCSQTPRAGSPCSPGDRSTGSQSKAVYALARLNTTHDILLSWLGSYMGGLCSEARLTPGLQRYQLHSLTAARDLLEVVEAIYARDTKAAALASAKDAMYGRMTALVSAAKEVVAGRIEEYEEEGILIPDNGKKLMDAATGCVRGAGECVAKSKFVIERIGDFELDLSSFGVGLGISTAPASPALNGSFLLAQTAKAEIKRESILPPPTVPEKTPPPVPTKEDINDQKPLPTLPTEATSTDSDKTISAGGYPFPVVPETKAAPPVKPESRRSSTISLLPPLPQLTPLLTQGEYTREADEKAAQKSARADSIGAASCTATDCTGSSSMRCSEFSLLSQTSTRATTPEPASSTSIATPLLNPELSMIERQMSVESSVASLSSMERCHSEDLAFNKDGQIIGGTLPALVERLTIHDSTPDAVFVATFYLTFRQFTTPQDFAAALVERFEEADEGTGLASPVHLRVYNVFKGWLESHWRHGIDDAALDIINNFASDDLKLVLPAAGKRLEALAKKVTQVDGPLVPRLVSGIGKATAQAQYSLPEAPAPTPNVTRNQLQLLRNGFSGLGTQPTILDFDPLELARQFTVKESKMFCSIKPEELVALEWNKKNNPTAPNVLAMSSLSTDLAHLVAETILDVSDIKRRAVVIKHWIKIADRCLELNNYDSLMAIMCTLNASTISRLKKTWELVSQKTKLVLENLRSIIDVSKNHAVLRARLRNHVPPCLPFLGTFLTDLTFIDVGNPSKRPVSIDGSTKQLINFDKHVKTARVISELQRFQIPYRITEVPEMQDWIDAQISRVHNSNSSDVQQLYRRSLLLEPRESRQGSIATDSVPAIPQPQPSVAQRIDLFAWAHAFKQQSSQPPTPS